MPSNALEQAASILSDAKDALQTLLEKEHNHLYIGFNARLTQMINQLAFTTGGALKTSEPAKFQPVTNFMGEELILAKKVKASDLTPKELERKLYNEKVTKLQEELPNLTNEQILEAYVNEPLVVRGVAKRAELDEYKDGEINSTFLDNIRQAFKDAEARKIAADKDENIKDENLIG